ncbi:MSH2 protein [Conglomerata obtusa]
MLTLQKILQLEDDKTISLFKKGEFYFIHSNLQYFTNYINHTESSVKVKELKEIKINSLQYADLINYIIKTLKISVKEYHFVENDTYEMNKEGSPINWNDFADILYEQAYQPLCSIAYENKNLFVSFFDIERNLVYYTNFKDDDIFSNLYSFLAEINSNEVLFENFKLEKSLANMGIAVNFVKAQKNAHNFDLDIEDAQKTSIRMLIDFLGIKDFKISNYIINTFMQIDTKTMQNLDFDSIIKLIEPTTKQGRRLLNQNLRQPLKDINELEKRFFFVEYFYYCDKNIIKGFPDFITYSKRILKLKVKDCIILYNALKKIDSIITALNERTNEYVYNEFLLPLININEANQQLFSEFEKIVDLDKNELRDEINDNITELKLQKYEITEKINEEYERVTAINKKIKLENSQNICQFKIPRSEYKILKENNFVEKSMLKSGIIFTTHSLEKHNEELISINNKLEHEEKTILNNFLMFMNNYSTSFDVLNHLIAQIDVYLGFSNSIDYGFTKPTFYDFFYIEKGFHPLVKECVKNDFELGTQPDKISNRFCVITGPNMGGKSTFMKQCAITCILAQIGCFVPCSKAVLPIIDGIYLRIGANDLSSKGMSTFMVEMHDIARICKKATSSSLIIIDELGRGTSAIDGLSLALSVKEFLITKKSFTFFATHFPEICGEDVINKRVKCEFDNNNLILLYEIEDGACDISYGVEIAEKIGFPKEVVLMAKELIKR